MRDGGSGGGEAGTRDDRISDRSTFTRDDRQPRNTPRQLTLASLPGL